MPSALWTARDTRGESSSSRRQEREDPREAEGHRTMMSATSARRRDTGPTSAGTREDREEEDTLLQDPDLTPPIPEEDTERGGEEEGPTLPDLTPLPIPDQEEEIEEERDLPTARRAPVLSAERAAVQESAPTSPETQEAVPRLPEDLRAPGSQMPAASVPTDQLPQPRTPDPRARAPRRSTEAEADLPKRETDPDLVPSPPRSLTK